jgi:hypothetical protein
MDEGENANRLESLALAVIFAAAALTLLCLLGLATKAGSAKAQWWTWPALAPGAALTVLTLANAVTLVRDLLDLRARPPTPAEWQAAGAAVLGWLRPLEFLAYYAAYVGAIRHAGYFPASLIFVTFLLWRAGLRARHWFLYGGVFCVALIGIFRAGLGVWMPVPALYDLAPEAVRLALMRWF